MCSPLELKKLRKKYPIAKFVTPGIRLSSETDDQTRTATPVEALEWGASALVIGRPILQVKDCRKFIKDLGVV